MWSETVGYRDYRPQYLPQFFVQAARQLALTGGQSMLDLGCGMGAVTFGFAPYVARMTGIDVEAPSLRILADRANALGLDVRTVEARVEEAPADLGPFDLITIGKAYWFMRSPATLTRIEGWLKPGGNVLICWPVEFPDDAPAWNKALSLLLIRWGGHRFRDVLRTTPEEFFAGSDFTQSDRIEALGEQIIGLEDLINRAQGYPGTSRAILGDKADRMVGDLRRVLPRFFRNGPIVEVLHTIGVVFRRRRDMEGPGE